jgi:hypothetical protein
MPEGRPDIQPSRADARPTTSGTVPPERPSAAESHRTVLPEPSEARAPKRPMQVSLTRPISSASIPVARIVAAKPLLASEALMEDLAPVEPGRKAARIWCGAVGIGFAALGLLTLLGLRPGGPIGAIPSLALGFIALLAAVARVTYRQRAVAMVVLGILADTTALRGASAVLAEAVGGFGWNAARTVTAIGIPAALLFRARYRAFAGARIFLAVALLAALPFLVHVTLLMRGDFGIAHAASIVALFAFLVSLSGFMGAETTGGGTLLAAFTIPCFSVELGLRAFASVPRTAGHAIEIGAFVAAFASASALAALGLFQIFAWRFAADARRIDIHSRPTESEDEPPRSGSDWMTGA